MPDQGVLLGQAGAVPEPENASVLILRFEGVDSCRFKIFIEGKVTPSQFVLAGEFLKHEGELDWDQLRRERQEVMAQGAGLMGNLKRNRG